MAGGEGGGRGPKRSPAQPGRRWSGAARGALPSERRGAVCAPYHGSWSAERVAGSCAGGSAVMVAAPSRPWWLQPAGQRSGRGREESQRAGNDQQPPAACPPGEGIEALSDAAAGRAGLAFPMGLRLAAVVSLSAPPAAAVLPAAGQGSVASARRAGRGRREGGRGRRRPRETASALRRRRGRQGAPGSGRRGGSGGGRLRRAASGSPRAGPQQLWQGRGVRRGGGVT